MKRVLNLLLSIVTVTTTMLSAGGNITPITAVPVAPTVKAEKIFHIGTSTLIREIRDMEDFGFGLRVGVDTCDYFTVVYNYERTSDGNYDGHFLLGKLSLDNKAEFNPYLIGGYGWTKYAYSNINGSHDDYVYGVGLDFSLFDNTFFAEVKELGKTTDTTLNIGTIYRF